MAIIIKVLENGLPKQGVPVRYTVTSSLFGGSGRKKWTNEHGYVSYDAAPCSMALIHIGNEKFSQGLKEGENVFHI